MVVDGLPRWTASPTESPRGKSGSTHFLTGLNSLVLERCVEPFSYGGSQPMREKCAGFGLEHRLLVARNNTGRATSKTAYRIRPSARWSRGIVARGPALSLVGGERRSKYHVSRYSGVDPGFFAARSREPHDLRRDASAPRPTSRSALRWVHPSSVTMVSCKRDVAEQSSFRECYARCRKSVRGRRRLPSPHACSITVAVALARNSTSAYSKRGEPGHFSDPLSAP